MIWGQDTVKVSSVERFSFIERFSFADVSFISVLYCIHSVGMSTAGSAASQPVAPQLSGVIREEEEGGEEEEEEEEEEGGVASTDHSHPEVAPSSSSSSSGGSSRGYVWRVDLHKTECHWRGWFDGLSQEFLSLPQPKLLILAGVDRLDKELTIGQMQGAPLIKVNCL